MKVALASVLCVAALAACSTDHPRPAPTVTVTQTVTKTPAPRVVTKSVPAPMPSACRAAISDAIGLTRLVGHSEGTESTIRDLLDQFQADLAGGNQAEANKLAERIETAKSNLGDTLSDLEDGLSTLQDDMKECNGSK